MKNRAKKLFYKLIRKSLGIIRLLNRDLYQKVFIKYLKFIGVKIEGTPTYISNDVFIDDVDYSLITIKNNSVISINVVILTHDYAVTRALIASKQNVKEELAIVKPVTIGENCFIGAGSIILPGTTIGNNVIVGAGSVVKGNIPDNVVVAGNPCKILCSIEEYLEKQLKYNKVFFQKNV